MNAPSYRSPSREIGVSLDSALLEDAEALGLRLPELMDAALRREVAAEKGRRWRKENAEAISFNNARIERDGLWCDDLRLF